MSNDACVAMKRITRSASFMLKMAVKRHGMVYQRKQMDFNGRKGPILG